MTGESEDGLPWVPPIRGAYSDPQSPQPPRRGPDLRELTSTRTPPPTVPPPPRRRLSVIAAVVLLLVVGALVGGAVAFGGEESDDATLSGGGDQEETVSSTTTSEGEDEDQGEDQGDDPSTTGGSSASPTTVGPPAADVEWLLVDDPGGSFRMSLPPSLTYAAVFGDLTGLGATMFPDDPDAQALMDQIAGFTLNGPQTRLVAIDGAKLTSDQLPADLVEVQGQTGFEQVSIDLAAAGYERVIADRQASTGVGIVNQGRLMGPAGDVFWYDVGGNDQVVKSRQYLIKSGDWLWVVICWVADFDSTRATTDRIAQSFQPL